MPGPCPTCGATRPCSCKRSDAERDIKACGQRDDAQPFPWSHVHAKKLSAPRRSTAPGSGKGIGSRAPEPTRTFCDELPFDPADMQAVAVALFGECKVPSCRALLEVDGSCPFASEHPKHECRGCGALHDEPITVAHACLFCANTEAAQ